MLLSVTIVLVQTSTIILGSAVFITTIILYSLCISYYYSLDILSSV